jgi:hypothetical protein
VASTGSSEINVSSLGTTIGGSSGLWLDSVLMSLGVLGLTPDTHCSERVAGSVPSPPDVGSKTKLFGTSDRPFPRGG